MAALRDTRFRVRWMERKGNDKEGSLLGRLAIQGNEDITLGLIVFAGHSLERSNEELDLWLQSSENTDFGAVSVYGAIEPLDVIKMFYIKQ